MAVQSRIQGVGVEKAVDRIVYLPDIRRALAEAQATAGVPHLQRSLLGGVEKSRLRAAIGCSHCAEEQAATKCNK